jgi:gentisate 1,2-dioxygenase
MQVVKPGAATRPHAHAWWHLFVVQAGQGTMRLGDAETPTSLDRGDVVMVPAWCAHSIENRAKQDDLILMSLTNLPQQAGLSNLLAKEPDDQVGLPSRAA